jgi:hypothetical protein
MSNSGIYLKELIKIIKILMIEAVPADIRIYYLLNGSVKPSRCAKLLGVNCKYGAKLVFKFPEFNSNAECSVLSFDNSFPHNKA